MTDNEINSKRNSDVIKVFFDKTKALSREPKHITQNEIIEMTVKSAAPRFYTTYEQARRFVSLLSRGQKLPLRNQNKIEMYNEIFRRYMEIKRKFNCRDYMALVFILEQPAPSFYIDIMTFRGILYKSYKHK